MDFCPYTASMQYDFSQSKKRASDVDAWLAKEFQTIRTGQATPALLDGVRVDSYGSKMPVNQVGNVGVEDARTIRITPWDTTQIKEIEQAISNADLGVSVIVDDKGLRVIFPDLTSERREQLIRLAKSKLEEARVSLRGVREETWTDIQSKEKDGLMSEDEKFRAKEEMQKMIDEYNKDFDARLVSKESEIKI